MGVCGGGERWGGGIGGRVGEEGWRGLIWMLLWLIPRERKDLLLKIEFTVFVLFFLIIHDVLVHGRICVDDMMTLPQAIPPVYVCIYCVFVCPFVCLSVYVCAYVCAYARASVRVCVCVCVCCPHELTNKTKLVQCLSLPSPLKGISSRPEKDTDSIACRPLFTKAEDDLPGEEEL